MFYKKHAYNQLLDALVFSRFPLFERKVHDLSGAKESAYHFRMRKGNRYCLHYFYPYLMNALARSSDKYQGTQLTIVPD